MGGVGLANAAMSSGFGTDSGRVWPRYPTRVSLYWMKASTTAFEADAMCGPLMNALRTLSWKSGLDVWGVSQRPPGSVPLP